MSLRSEQYWALKKTRQFLMDMYEPKKRPKTVKELRLRLRSCTKHFPPLDEDGMPHFSPDPWGPDDPPLFKPRKKTEGTTSEMPAVQ